MTEKQWLASSDPQFMLGFLGTRATPRKLQLFACACLRQAWQWSEHLGFRRAVLVGERFADGHLSKQEMRAVFRLAWPQGWEPVRSAATALLAAYPEWQLYGARGLAAEIVALSNRCSAEPMNGKQPPSQAVVRRTQAHLLRDLFGNPFQPVLPVATWLTPDVVDLAKAIHEEGMLENLPVLGDALEEAGCASAEMLDHLRGRRPHHCGCWALDLVLGRR